MPDGYKRFKISMCSYLNINIYNFDYFRIQGVDKSLADIIRVRLEHQGAGKTVLPSLKRHFFSYTYHDIE